MTTGDDADPFDDDSSQNNPFAGLPMFGDIARALSGQGPLNWDAARQFAQLAATGGAPEANVDPSIRFALTDLAGIAELHVGDLTGCDVSGYVVSTPTPGVWALQALEAYRPLFTEMATSLRKRKPNTEELAEIESDPMANMMRGLSEMMAPSMLGMSIGSTVGQLAKRAFGDYDLPIPRSHTSQLTLLPGAIDQFADDWSLNRDSVRLWVVSQELTTRALFSVAHIRDGLSALVRAHVAAFEADPEAVAEKLSGLDLGGGDMMQSLQRSLGDPEILLGAVSSPAQQAMQPQLDAALAVVVGYVDYVVDGVAQRLIGGESDRISEAVRRRRIEAAPEDAFVERLLGLQLNRQLVERGRSFIAGVLERAGHVGVNQLLEREGSLPTPAEIDAPGLWLARIEFGD